MLTEQELDALEFIILDMFTSYRIGVVDFANKISNMTDAKLISRDEVNNHASQEMFIREKFQNEDVIYYLSSTLMEFQTRVREFDNGKFNDRNIVLRLNHIVTLLDLYNTEMSKRGELSGV